MTINSKETPNFWFGHNFFMHFIGPMRPKLAWQREWEGASTHDFPTYKTTLSAISRW